MLKQAADSGLREVRAMGGPLPGTWGGWGLAATKICFSFLLDHRPKLSSGCFSPRSHTWTSRELCSIFGLLPTMGYEISTIQARWGPTLIKERTLELGLSSVLFRRLSDRRIGPASSSC